MTELQNLINNRDMVQVGNWNMAKVVTDSWSQYNSIVPDKQHVESVNNADSSRTMWQHKDEKTWLTVSKHPNGTFETKWKVVVYMGSNETEKKGPGWTCGVDCYADSPKEAVEWAYEYMNENQDVSHLYE